MSSSLEPRQVWWHSSRHICLLGRPCAIRVWQEVVVTPSKTYAVLCFPRKLKGNAWWGKKKASVMKELPSDIWHPLLLSSLNQQREGQSRRGEMQAHTVWQHVRALWQHFLASTLGENLWRLIKYLVEEKVTVIRLLHLLEELRDLT